MRETPFGSRTDRDPIDTGCGHLFMDAFTRDGQSGLNGYIVISQLDHRWRGGKLSSVLSVVEVQLVP